MTDAQTHYQNGNQAIAAGDIDRAIAEWTTAIELDPHHASALNNRGNAWREKKNHAKALQDLDEAIKLDPKLADAWLNRANVYMDKFNFKQAIQDLDRTLELNPEDADAYFNRGNAYSALKNHQQAVADYNQAIRLKPTLAPAYANLAGIKLQFLKDTDGALADISKAIELAPNPFYYKNRGNLFMLQGQVERALSDFSKALELKPDFLDVLMFRCNAYYKAKLFDKAIVDATRAIELVPKDPTPYFNRGIAKRGQGDLHGAILDFTAVVMRNPKFVMAYPNRAECYTELGEKKRAAVDWESYLALGGGKQYGDQEEVEQKIKKLRRFFPF